MFGEVMKVENVKFGINNSVAVQKKMPYRQSFTGIQDKATKLNMKEEVKNFMPPLVKGMKKISDNMGEIQNIIINALGTGLVAPIFIKWNPLSKTDADTREYSAWRQPVSAILAVVTQVGVTIPFNRMIDKLSNNGYYDENYNKTLFQDKSYIEKIIKRNYPYASKKQINEMVTQKMTDQQNNLIRMIKADNIVMSNDKGETFKLSENTYRQLQAEVLQKKLDYANSELNKCLNISIPKKTQRAEYYRTHTDQAREIFNDLDQKLDATNAPNDIKKLVKKLKKQYKNGDPELIAIFDDILARRGNNDQDLKTAMQAKLKGILKDIKFYTEDKTFNSKEDLAEFIKGWETEQRINPIKSEISVLEEMKKRVLNKDTMASIEDYLDTIIIKNKDHRLAKFKFSKEISNLLQETVKNNIKAHKQLTGLRVSLLILPVSCWLLNWTYPKFMDAVFPNLSNKKHPNEIKDLVNKANKQTEVKS